MNDDRPLGFVRRDAAAGPPPPGRCAGCLLRTEVCICPEVPRVETRTRVLIVRHAVERWKPSNTARLAALALPRCEIVDYGARGEPFDARILDGLEDAWLLFPEASAAPDLARPPGVLVVVDGTWQQARRIVQRVPRLARLPRLALPAPAVPPRRLRQARRADGHSTLEAIARALALLEGETVAQPLERLHARFVTQSLAASGIHG